MTTEEGALEGVQFRAIDGRRSSQRTAQHVFAVAADAVDPDLATRVRSARDWRKSYLQPVRDLTASGTKSPNAPVDIARSGIKALDGSMELVRAGDGVPLAEALGEFGKPHFTTVMVDGTEARERRLTIPYRNELLEGDDLLLLLDRWVSTGAVEPSCAEAIRAVDAHADWLDLSDLRFVLLGAASEMGPLPWLSRWGAEVIAIDLPRPALWKRIAEIARRGAGRVHVPVPIEGGSEGDVADVAGADLLTQTPEIATLLHDLDQPFVLGNYVYADGANFVRLSTAVDVLTRDLQASGKLAALAYLATPTDVFAVTPEVVEGARSKLRMGPARAALRAVSAGRLYRRQYESTIRGDDGREWGIYDCLVPQQGSNYALAKTQQKWRAIVAADTDLPVSANVAPATLTRSVLKNRVLAAAYAGAGRFGVEIFEPETSSALEAALLVHDLRAAGGTRAHPYDLFVEKAAHGGLWRMPHQPRSVLPLAVVGGMMRRTRP